MLPAFEQNTDRLQLTTDSFRKTVRSFWAGDVLWDCPMAKYSTLKAGGQARAVIFPSSREELAKIITGLQLNNINWKVIGRGSNILVTDEGFDGTILVLGAAFAKVYFIKEADQLVAVGVEAGCGLARLVKWCMESSISGLEFAAGIPGSVGGAIIMNAGAWGQEISEVVASVTFMDGHGNMRVVDRDQMDFGYRCLKDVTDRIVVAVNFILKRSKRHDIEAKCENLKKQRQEKQPLDVASAGSFFKNPQGAPAGKLIEEAGLKGYRIGGAMVSEKHANFIVNTGRATATEILDLMRHVQHAVKERAGIFLEPEVHILGTGKKENSREGRS